MQHHPALPTRDSRIDIVYRPIDQLKQDPRNPRRHERKQIRQIADSIAAFGFNVPIVRHQELLKKHTRGEEPVDLPGTTRSPGKTS
jgi:ParB-like chromosome segregation protein Spo0J